MAKKKIVDISPPEKNQKVQEFKKSTAAKEPLLKSLPSFCLKKPVLIVVGILLAALLSFVFIKPQAEVEVWPVKETVQFQVEFSTAGQLMTRLETASQEFVATGQAVKEEKAQGVIKVYNNYHLDQILVANTRFWCFEGDELREFKTKERVVIPAKEQLDVEVAASGPGPEYNIDPCTFSVPGLKGSARYTAVYGKSSLPMTGGAKIETNQVSQEDLDRAETIVAEKALAQARTSLVNAISPEEYILPQEAIEAKIVKTNPLTGVGQNVDNFIFQAEAQSQALVFKKDEMEEFARAYILEQIPAGKELVEGSLAVGYLLKKVDLTEPKIVLELEISAEIYQLLDEGSVKESVKGLMPNELLSGLRKFPNISRVETDLWPFWARRVPQEVDRIKIKLNLAP